MRPSRIGYGLLGALPLLCALAAGDGLGALLCLLAIIAVSTLLAADALLCPTHEIEVHRHHPQRIPIGAPAQVKLEVRNKGPKSLSIRLEDTPSPELRAGSSSFSLTLEAEGSLQLSYELHPDRRGRFSWSGCWIERRGRFALCYRSYQIPNPSTLAVTPDIRPLRLQRGGQAALARWTGRHRSRRRGTGTEMESLREAITGDDPRLIDWKATARRQRLISRNLELERNRQVVFLIDAGRWMGAAAGDLTKLDYAINATLFSASTAIRYGDRVGALCFSDHISSWHPPARGPRTLPRLLEDLNHLKAATVEPDYLLAFRTLAKKLRRRSLMILLSDLSDPGTGAALLRSISVITRRHVVLCLHLIDPELEAASRTRPKCWHDLALRAVSDSLLDEREEVVRSLMAAGAHVVSTRPEELALCVVERYLELKGRGLV